MTPTITEYLKVLGVPLDAEPRVQAFDAYVQEAEAKWEVLREEDLPRLLVELNSGRMCNFSDIVLKMATTLYLENGWNTDEA